MVCHHIDWDGLQILIDAKNGHENLTYKCLLCDTIFNQEEYKDIIKAINEKKKDNTLRFYRTPKGQIHEEEECPDDKVCDIHSGLLL